MSFVVREVEEEALIRLPDPGALETWSRWVTPTIERKRFDAWFFVARLPEDAVPTHDDHEVTASAWVDPIDALERYGDGEMIFAPPTWYTLWDLSRYAGVDAVIAEGARRHVRPVMPRFEEVEGEMVILLPGDTLYPDGNGVDGPTRLRDVAADVDALDVDVDPRIRSGILGLDGRRALADLEARQLLEGGGCDYCPSRTPCQSLRDRSRESL